MRTFIKLIVEFSLFVFAIVTLLAIEIALIFGVGEPSSSSEQMYIVALAVLFGNVFVLVLYLFGNWLQTNIPDSFRRFNQRW